MSDKPAPIYIVSGGAGALGKHLARVALAQFPGVQPQVIIIPQIREMAQIEGALDQVAARGGMIIHTLVDSAMRAALVSQADERGIPQIDTIGPPLGRLAAHLGQMPAGRPGLYQGEQNVYQQRIAAIEYTVDHDDGRNPNELHEADLILCGVSRVGKTPLSIYLSVLGWKVANVPLVKDIPPPAELFSVDPRRVIGLTIRSETLQQHRRYRQEGMQGMGGRSYSDFEALDDELTYSVRIFRQGGFSMIDVTNRPIEESADRVIALITRYFQQTLRP